MEVNFDSFKYFSRTFAFHYMGEVEFYNPPRRPNILTEKENECCFMYVLIFYRRSM